MAHTNTVTVTRNAAGNWELAGGMDRAELVLLGNTHWLLPVGYRDTDLAWDGWSTSEAEALGHAVACMAWA